MILIRTMIVRSIRRWLLMTALLVWLVPMPAKAAAKETQRPWLLNLNGIGG